MTRTRKRDEVCNRLWVVERNASGSEVIARKASVLWPTAELAYLEPY
jgi:hypothetical protein